MIEFDVKKCSCFRGSHSNRVAKFFHNLAEANLKNDEKDELHY